MDKVILFGIRCLLVVMALAFVAGALAWISVNVYVIANCGIMPKLALVIMDAIILVLVIFEVLENI